MAKSKVDLNKLVDSTINFISPEILEKGNSLITDLSESPIMTTVNSDQIREAILNIITNANQATEAGVLTVKTRQEDGEAIIEISDTGCGIKQEDLKHIFTPFFTKSLHGTGLGLTITNRIIQEHRGRIDVESVLDKPGKADEKNNVIKKRGTTFKIHLPLDET
jgi:two-component system sensor histidine kinase HydH